MFDSDDATFSDFSTGVILLKRAHLPLDLLQGASFRLERFIETVSITLSDT